MGQANTFLIINDEVFETLSSDTKLETTSYNSLCSFVEG